MYVDRTIPELENVPTNQWNMKELAYHFQTLNQMQNFLNEEGKKIHNMIQREIESRGGLPKSEGAWDHSSEIIFD